MVNAIMNSSVDAVAMDDLAQARAHKEAAEYEVALQCYRRAIAGANGDLTNLPTAYVEMGLVLGFMGEFDLSLAVLQKSVACWPTSAYAHLNLGKTLLMLGQYDEARPSLQQAVELTPPGDPIHCEASHQLGLMCQCGY